MLTKLYRYEEVRYAPSLDAYDYPQGPGRLDIRVFEFKVIKETKCGVWIKDKIGSPKFVNLNARKQYACKTAAEARLSFIARKTRQHRILSAQIRDVEKSLELVSAPIIK